MDAHQPEAGGVTGDLDRADETHEVIALLHRAERTAAAALLDLPPDVVVCKISDSETGEIIGDLTADQLLADLRTDVASPDVVLRILRRNIRPGFGGAQ